MSQCRFHVYSVVESKSFFQSDAKSATVLFSQHWLQYCTRIAFAQALKASDPGINGKICKGKNGSDYTGTTEKCNENSGGTNGTFAGFAEKGLANGTAKWPTHTNTNDNATAVSRDIVALTKDDKVIVAGHLAKSIEGGEVVETEETDQYLKQLQRF